MTDDLGQLYKHAFYMTDDLGELSKHAFYKPTENCLAGCGMPDASFIYLSHHIMYGFGR